MEHFAMNNCRPPARLLLLKCIEISLEKGIVENFKCFMDLFQSLCMILGLKSNEATIDCKKTSTILTIDFLRSLLFFISVHYAHANRI